MTDIIPEDRSTFVIIISLNSSWNKICVRQKLWRKSKHKFYVQ